MHVGVSGRGTPLAAPGRRTPDNLLGCIRDIGSCINEGWVLTAKFEEDGSQILCSRFHDDLAHLDTTGEEDEVERQLQKFCDLVFASRDSSNGARVEVLRDEIQQNLTGGRQTLREFEDAWIARRKNLARRVEEQGQWSIERTDHQGDTVRFPVDLGTMPALPKGLRHDHIYRLHPLFQLLLREGGGSDWRHNLEDFFLAGGLEVGAHRRLKSLGILITQVLKACQLIDAPLVRLGGVRIEICFLLVEDFLERIHLSLPRTSLCRCRFSEAS